MSDKKTIYLVGPRQKQYAKELIDQAPDNYLCEIRKKTRSLEQNSRLWAMLTDISKQVLWYGKHLGPESWKNIFSASLKRQEVVPGLDNDFVVIGQQTSKMSVSEMRDMQELMTAFGDERDVRWSDNDGIF